MRRFLPDLFTIGLLLCVLLASLFPAHGTFAHGFGIATDCAIALLFFLHGARLSRDTVIAGLLHWRLHLLILAITFGVFPLLGLAIGLIPDSLLPHPLYLGILYLCVLPSTVQSSIAFTSIAGGNIPAAICSASASNILGMFITPLLVGLLFSLGQTAGGFSLDSLQTILLQLLVPFVAGQVLQPWVGAWIRARKKLLMPVDRGSILMVVYLAFSHAVIEGVWHQFSLENLAMIVLLDILLLICVLGLTLVGSRVLGFNRADQITILFCGSKKSLVSGVPMANAIFSSAMIGAVVLPIMLFHQIQLMACAWIAARYAARPAAE